MKKKTQEQSACPKRHDLMCFPRHNTCSTKIQENNLYIEGDTCCSSTLSWNTPCVL